MFMRMIWLAPLIVLAAPVAASPPDKSFTMKMSVRPDTAEGQLLLAREAYRRCAPLLPQPGRYQFEGVQQLGKKTQKPITWKVRQQFTCGSAPPTPVQTPAAVDPNWQPTPEIDRAIRDATIRYFALVDAADGMRAHAIWSASNRAMTPLAERQALLSSSRKTAGEPLGHRIDKLTWYVNPEGADTPGLYVAVDYEKRYRNLALSCGYLMWFQEADGRFVLVREESGTLTKAHAATMSQNILAEVRTQLRCPPV